MRGVRERRGKCEYLVAGSPAGVVLGHVEWQGEGSVGGMTKSLASHLWGARKTRGPRMGGVRRKRRLRESLAAGDHPENWRAAFTRWRAAV